MVGRLWTRSNQLNEGKQVRTLMRGGGGGEKGGGDGRDSGDGGGDSIDGTLGYVIQ